MNNPSEKYWVWFVYSALTVITFAVFWQVHNFEFINYDDPTYVSTNRNISSGLSSKGIVWVFTHELSGNWHPLTGLSHMLDCQLFGLNPGRHHLVNLFFHLANSLLLFTILRKMTRALWQSAFVAALFALHPLHVESVAWISERKDVLSTLFWILTMFAYFKYATKPTAGHYLLTLLLFALGLMAKPMLVTVPFALLLLDYWPLNRLENDLSGKIKWQTYRRLVWEKIPLFALTAISSTVTIFAQRSGGALREAETFPAMIRAANAIASYGQYMVKMAWPRHLSVIYPLIKSEPPYREACASAIVLVIITILVIRMGAKYKYLPTGWFWYLGTLVPVIGLIQVGDQAMADRYSYVPFIGLFIIVAWGANDLLEKWKCHQIIIGAASVAVILVLSVCTWHQLGYWRNSQSLFEHVVNVTKRNYIAYNNLGFAMIEQGKFNDAINNYKNAIKAKGDYLPAYNNLGATYISISKYSEAMEVYKEALRIKPDSAEILSNLGVACFHLGRSQEAIDNYKQAVRLKPNYIEAHYNLGLAYLTTGNKDSAMTEYEILKKLDIEKANALLNIMKK